MRYKRNLTSAIRHGDYRSIRVYSFPTISRDSRNSLVISLFLYFAGLITCKCGRIVGLTFERGIRAADRRQGYSVLVTKKQTREQKSRVTFDAR